MAELEMERYGRKLAKGDTVYFLASDSPDSEDLQRDTVKKGTIANWPDDDTLPVIVQEWGGISSEDTYETSVIEVFTPKEVVQSIFSSIGKTSPDVPILGAETEVDKLLGSALGRIMLAEILDGEANSRELSISSANQD